MSAAIFRRRLEDDSMSRGAAVADILVVSEPEAASVFPSKKKKNKNQKQCVNV